MQPRTTKWVRIALFMLLVIFWPKTPRADIFLTYDKAGVPVFTDQPPSPRAVPFLRAPSSLTKTAAQSKDTRESRPDRHDDEPNHALVMPHRPTATAQGEGAAEEPHPAPKSGKSFHSGD